MDTPRRYHSFAAYGGPDLDTDPYPDDGTSDDGTSHGDGDDVDAEPGTDAPADERRAPLDGDASADDREREGLT
jgi:hypothetical protein